MMRESFYDWNMFKCHAKENSEGEINNWTNTKKYIKIKSTIYMLFC